jgi:hypothetical protein
MDLVNVTPLAAKVAVSQLAWLRERWGMLIAKATYRIEEQRPVLDVDDPLPILQESTSTPGGTHPQDTLPRRGDDFEVVVVGEACAPRGQLVSRQQVSLRVDDVRRDLDVFGDRVWMGDGQDARPSEPLPFERMPLTWDRAFGGSVVVEVDKGARLPLSHPLNPWGRGFDAGGKADDLGREWKVPRGYPIVHGDRHTLLPNVEDSEHPVTTRADDPRPMCWETLPVESPLRMGDRFPSTADHDDWQRMFPNHSQFLRRLYTVTHPSLILGPPGPVLEAEIDGMHPDGRVGFRWRRESILADYIVGPRRGTLALTPHLLILLPNEKRFAVVYRTYFRVDYVAGEERSFRLRIGEAHGHP